MNSNKNKFIEKAKKIHGDKYDYSLIDYTNNRTKVEIICSIHGIFEQRPYTHLNSGGCFKCCGSIKHNKESFTIKDNGIHNNKYDYSMLEYKNNKELIKIICDIHGMFTQRPDSHLNGKGCKKCYYNSKLKSNDNFKKECKYVFGDTYDYSLVNYKNSNEKVKIVCKKHGLFLKNPSDHIHKKSGCPKCKSSKGETKIRNYLEDNDIKHISEHPFDNLKSNKNYKLKYDFYLPEHNTLIEYDGVQHFKIVERFGGRSAFMKRRHRDKLKDKYCLDNNIELIRIPYTDFNNIEIILKSKI